MIAGIFSDDEIWTFGEVVTRLADEIEVAARAQLSERLARFDQAPVNIIHKLAFDDAIEVAGPSAAGIQAARDLRAGRQCLHQEPGAHALDLASAKRSKSA